MTLPPTPWLPSGWEHPTRAELSTGHHLRLVRAADVHLDLPAVMGSQERLWSIYGPAWGWPSETMTADEDRAYLARREAAADRHESFSYAVFDTGETELLGSVYIDPAGKVGADAEITWWVVDWLVGSPVEASLDAFVPQWIATVWPLRRPRYVGRDLSWLDWLALPDLG
jgi:hypothetical protein